MKRVVKIETRASGPREPQLPHQRLCAVMPATQSESLFVRECREVVRMRPFRVECDECATAIARPENPDAGNALQSRKRVSSKRGVVLENGASPNAVQIIHGGTEPDGTG